MAGLLQRVVAGQSDESVDAVLGGGDAFEGGLEELDGGDLLLAEKGAGLADRELVEVVRHRLLVEHGADAEVVAVAVGVRS